MSKMDQLRALREAKYAQATTQMRPRAAAPTMPARAAVAPTKPSEPESPTAEPASAAATATSAEAAAAGEQLCGHRSMNGRTCTREQGHAAKSHRYS